MWIPGRQRVPFHRVFNPAPVSTFFRVMGTKRRDPSVLAPLEALLLLMSTNRHPANESDSKRHRRLLLELLFFCHGRSL